VLDAVGWVMGRPSPLKLFAIYSERFSYGTNDGRELNGQPAKPGSHEKKLMYVSSVLKQANK